MKDWQERLLEETKELQDRIISLSKFILTSKDKEVSNPELLSFQLQAMCMYHSILIERIKNLFDLTMCKTEAQIHEWIDEQLAEIHNEPKIEVRYITEDKSKDLSDPINEIASLMKEIFKNLRKE